MPNFVRWYEKGATYFFTVVTHGRWPILTSELGRRCLREAWQDVAGRFPFETEAVCLLPEHVHCLWSLPEEDEDFSVRWRAIAKKGDSPVCAPGKVLRLVQSPFFDAAVFGGRGSSRYAHGVAGAAG